MKNKIKVEVRLDEDLVRKAMAVASHEGLTFNNYVIKLIRSGAAYHERVHGRIDVSKWDLPEESVVNED